MLTGGVVRTRPDVRVRREDFGALVRWPGSPQVIRLAHAGLLLLELCRTPRPVPVDGAALAHLDHPPSVDRPTGPHDIGPPEGWPGLIEALHQTGVLEIHATNSDGAAGRRDDVASTSQRWPQARPWDAETVQAALASTLGAPLPTVARPFWAHLQPFTRCNQHCVHCYCNGGPKADPFLLPPQDWRRILAILDDYGVFDIYVTGGESLLYDEFFDLATEILDRGLGFGLSTNATLLAGRVLDRLKDLHIGLVQVSLDGADAPVHEFIRGSTGSFQRTLTGISSIGEFASVVINTVVNRINIHQLEAVVKIGKDLGCTEFKFFPQKPVGRSTLALTLSDAEIMDELVPECARLAATHDVVVETIDPDRPCGSGSIGLAVDQRGDVYPCIFGIINPGQRCGNLLTESLEDIWCRSPVLASFRGAVTTPCRRCEA